MDSKTVKKPLFKSKKSKIIVGVSATLAVVAAAAVFAVPKLMGGKVVDVAQVSMISGSWWGEQKGCYGYIEEGGTYNVPLENGLLPGKTFVEPGQRVEVGDALFEYDMTSLELAGESASISYKMAENDLKKAKELLEEYKTYTVFQPPKPVIVDGVDKLELVEKGDLAEGAENDPVTYEFTCDLETLVTPGFLAELLELTEEVPVPPAGESPEQGSDTGDNSELLPQQPSSQESTEPSPEEEQPEAPPTETVVTRKARRAVLHVYHSLGAEYSSVHIATIVVDGKKDVEAIAAATQEFRLGEVIEVASMGDVSVKEGSALEKQIAFLAVTAVPEPPVIPEDQRETQQEIDELVETQQRTVRDLELHVKQKKIDLEKALAETWDKTVLAKYGGTVTSVADIDSMEVGSPYIVISSDTGYRVVGTVSETNLPLVKVGDVLRVYSWMTGAEMTATVTEIGDIPQQWGNSMSMENPNSSYYQFYATLETNEVFDRWSDVEIYFGDSTPEGSGDTMYLPLPYVKEEAGGKHYVLVLDENEKTVFREVQVGKTIYGSMIEIKSGLSMEDYVAFPYGKNAVEGASPNYDGEIYY